MDLSARAHAAQRAAALGRNNRRVGLIHRLSRCPQLAASHRTWSRTADADARARARTRLIRRQVRSVGWAVHVARERQFCAPGHGRAICRRRQVSAGTSRSHLVQPAECGCDLAVSIGSADRPGAQNGRSRATWTAQPTDRTWHQIRRVRARSRIGIRCARPRSVTGRKLRAAGQTMDAAHASAVQSRVRCSLSSMSARVEIHGLDRPLAPAGDQLERPKS